MINKYLVYVFLKTLNVYKKFVSPILPNSCRFYPSCSDYCKDALIEHGAAFGLWLGMNRLCKCHPLCSGGYDPVPKK